MRILMLTKYDDAGASSRLRSLQYVTPLRKLGIEADVQPLLDDGYVADLYSGQVSTLKVARSYVRRLRAMWGMKRYDAVWVEKELLPWMPLWLELLASPRRPAIIVDYDDALFHRYDRHPAWAVRALLGKKIDGVMRNASLVTTGNEYLASHARDAGATHIEWLPTVVDLERYPFPSPRRVNEEVVIGWIGSPSTAQYLNMISPALEILKRRHNLRCVAIGARVDQVSGTPFDAIEWQAEREVTLLSDIDIGVMPLADEPWERGKCGYKLIQYMAVGRPVVASPVGVNASLVIDGRNGFLADTQEEWVSVLEGLISQPELRTSMGLKGRAQVEATYSLQAQAPRLAAMLRSLGPQAREKIE